MDRNRLKEVADTFLHTVLDLMKDGDSPSDYTHAKRLAWSELYQNNPDFVAPHRRFLKYAGGQTRMDGDMLAEDGAQIQTAVARVLKRDETLKAYRKKWNGESTDDGEQEDTDDDDGVIDTTDMSDTKRIYTLYLKWIEQENVVPADEIITHFANCKPTSVYNARHSVRKLGYVLEKQKDRSWKVAERPDDKTAKEIDELKTMMAKMQQRLNELEAK